MKVTANSLRSVLLLAAVLGMGGGVGAEQQNKDESCGVKSRHGSVPVEKCRRRQPTIPANCNPDRQKRRPDGGRVLAGARTMGIAGLHCPPPTAHGRRFA